MCLEFISKLKNLRNGWRKIFGTKMLSAGKKSCDSIFRGKSEKRCPLSSENWALITSFLVVERNLNVQGSRHFYWKVQNFLRKVFSTKSLRNKNKLLWNVIRSCTKNVGGRLRVIFDVQDCERLWFQSSPMHLETCIYKNAKSSSFPAVSKKFCLPLLLPLTVPFEVLHRYYQPPRHSSVH